jgi:hypothetical protein
MNEAHQRRRKMRGHLAVIIAVLAACAAGWFCGYKAHDFTGPDGGRSVLFYDNAGEFRLWLAVPPGTRCDDGDLAQLLDRVRGFGRTITCYVPVSEQDLTGCDRKKAPVL